MKVIPFYSKNIKRLKELGKDCPECIKDKKMCRHYDYLKDYIKELEAMPPLYEQKFEAFWKEYPRKIGKKYAERMWKRLKVDDALFEIIMKALENHKKSLQWTKDKGQFIPNPSTWINQERWNDEVELPGNIKNSKYGEHKLFKSSKDNR